MAGSPQPVRLQSQKLVKTLCFEAFNQLSLLLKPERLGKDWRSLADLIGFNNEEIMYLAEEKEPVVELMKEWVKRHQEGATIGKLTDYLKELGRLDVIEDLQDYFGIYASQILLIILYSIVQCFFFCETAWNV